MENVKKILYTKNIPDPIYLLEQETQRLSNFLLWQLAYSEIFFEKKLWPEFNAKDYNKIIKNFKKLKETLVILRDTRISKRLVSSLILIPFCFFIIIKGFAFNIFLLICFLITSYEWYMMSKKTIIYLDIFF